jgi:hypothetical protein
MNPEIRNSSDLKAEIFRLERMEVEQSAVLKQHFSSPSAIISSVFSLFSSPSGKDGKKGNSIFNQDILGLISRFVLPVTLNTTIFRHSNFLIKTLVGVLSQKASQYVSEDSVGNMWHKLVSLFGQQEGKNSGGIIGTIKSIFNTQKSKRPNNYPANIPTKQNVLKTE